MGFDGEKGGLPRVVKDCIQYLRSTGPSGFSPPVRLALPRSPLTSSKVCTMRASSADRRILSFSSRPRKRMTEVILSRRVLALRGLALTMYARTGHVVSLETFGDPHLAAVLLKKYLHDLPEPVFPERLYPVIRRCPPPTSDPDDMSSIMYIRETLLPELPPCVYILLSNVLRKFNKPPALGITSLTVKPFMQICSTKCSSGPRPIAWTRTT